ncbi:Dolichyl-phosphate beta-glucosyltransferase [Penicillium atrosanguineum]|uniref:Dolichyl-phosphate beta-glucosyltransferase n=1 Tax=Penicillium atrosanguineum TaxID=1132637 RepID=UPI002382353A|nr:Dolichyl-phosphate beta-glucosyltransferase [Penicillium atrosanguineum]KAJ5304613.1 Dolichyl-phosphate beta-glucosyltransferase [Penicillium atrosanguineum]
MSSFNPPPGPPPPSVPEGWKAQYDERYQTWFYVNIATGKSQWDPPQAPTPSADGPAPSEPPPSYNQTGPADPAMAAVMGDKKQSMASNNPYNPSNASQSRASPSMIDEDARLAAKLQAEEDAHGGRGGSRGPIPGAAADYYSDPSRPQSAGAGYSPGPSSQSPMPEQKRSKGGFLSKLMGKSSGSSSRPSQPQYASYPQQQQQQQQQQQPGGYYNSYPQQPAPRPGYGYPQQGYGGYPPQGGYYPQQQPPRKSGGMGTAGAAALGVGGGLVGGMLLADAMEDMGDHNDYDNGGYDGGGGGWDDGGGGGGGDDFGGGDF